MAPRNWPPTAEERAEAKMREATFLLVLRAWLLRKRTERMFETKHKAKRAEHE